MIFFFYLNVFFSGFIKLEDVELEWEELIYFDIVCEWFWDLVCMVMFDFECVMNYLVKFWFEKNDIWMLLFD